MKKIYLLLSLLPNLLFAQQEFSELKIKSYSPRIYLQRDTNVGGFIQGIQTQLLDGKNNWFFGNLNNDQWIVSKGDFNGIRFLVKENGNVGIGSRDPKSKLDVNGFLTLAGNAANLDRRFDPDKLKNAISNTGKVAIGWNLSGGKGETDFISNRGLGSTGGFSFYDIDNSGNINHLLNLHSNGNVGIGTTNPTEKLDVEGNAKIKSYSPRIYLQRDTNVGGFIQGIQTQLLDGKDNWFFGNLHQDKWIVSKGDFTDIKFSINENGNAALHGKLEAKEIKVTETPTADFVFEEDYALPTLQEVEQHIKEKKHLPEIASAKKMEKDGVNIGEFQIQLLQKIEELTLYIIEQNKSLEKQNKRINELEKINKL